MKRKKKDETNEQPKVKKQGKKFNVKALLGEYKPTAVFTAVNFVTGVLWLVTYIGCTMMRASVFDKALTQMATAQQNFTVTVTSPAFPILRAALYILPVLWIVWGVLVYIGDKKAKITDKKLLFTVIGLIVAVCFTALLDVTRLGIFSYL